jgi:hypothetical protein
MYSDQTAIWPVNSGEHRWYFGACVSVPASWRPAQRRRRIDKDATAGEILPHRRPARRDASGPNVSRNFYTSFTISTVHGGQRHTAPMGATDEEPTPAKLAKDIGCAAPRMAIDDQAAVPVP